MIIDVKESLKQFLEDREHIRPTAKQKKEWIKSIEIRLDNELGDNDIFFDNMPEGVKEDE